MSENSNSLVESLTRLAEPLAASLGLGLWGVEILSGGRSVVRIFVESLEGEQGVDIDECAHLSRLLSLSLDVDDIIPGAYTLEISSPGLERRFFTAGQLAAAVGQHVEVTLADPAPAFPQRRKFQGQLRSASLEGRSLFGLAVEDAAQGGGADEARPMLEFSFEDARKVRQLHVVPEKSLPGKRKKGAAVKKDKASEGKGENAAPLDASSRITNPAGCDSPE